MYFAQVDLGIEKTQNIWAPRDHLWHFFPIAIVPSAEVVITIQHVIPSVAPKIIAKLFYLISFTNVEIMAYVLTTYDVTKANDWPSRTVTGKLFSKAYINKNNYAGITLACKHYKSTRWLLETRKKQTHAMYFLNTTSCNIFSKTLMTKRKPLPRSLMQLLWIVSNPFMNNLVSVNRINHKTARICDWKINATLIQPCQSLKRYVPLSKPWKNKNPRRIRCHEGIAHCAHLFFSPSIPSLFF